MSLRLADFTARKAAGDASFFVTRMLSSTSSLKAFALKGCADIVLPNTAAAVNAAVLRVSLRDCEYCNCVLVVDVLVVLLVAVNAATDAVPAVAMRSAAIIFMVDDVFTRRA